MGHSKPKLMPIRCSRLKQTTTECGLILKKGKMMDQSADWFLSFWPIQLLFSH